MEEENFFYYLTANAGNTRRWENEEVEQTTLLSQQQQQSMQENKSDKANSNSNELGESNSNISFDESISDASNLSYDNDNDNQSTSPLSAKEETVEETVATNTTFLLPPMNGTVNYSNMKTTSLPNSLQSSRHSAGVSKLGIGSSLHGIQSNVLAPTLERGDSFFKPLVKRSSSSFFEPLSRRASSFVEPFNDHQGKAKSVIAGLFNLFVVGIIVGVIMPKNQALPTPWYRVLSSIIGYSYFIFWCASFYPQIVMNYQRKSTHGLSIDYTVINFLGYVCYTTYTSAFYWDNSVKAMYRERHSLDNPDSEPAEITVESNDVAFAIHALIMSIIWLYQLEIYGGFEKMRKQGKRIVSRPIATLIYIILGTSIGYGALILLSDRQYIQFDLTYVKSYLNWLDYLYFLSFMKVLITMAKYIPQVVMNMMRKSCVGWNVWNILLDITGGILSLAQLVADAYDLNDMSSIAGNSAKLGLSAVSIIFDVSTSTI
jgi:cystinosin